MINLLIAGRPVIPESASQVVSPTQLVFSIPASPPFSHLAVFRALDQVIPPGLFGAVYVQLPGEPGFRPLGYVSNDKQSAIFRLNLKGAGGGGGSGGDAMMDDSLGAVTGVADESGMVMVGISLEPETGLPTLLETIKSQSQAQTTVPNGLPSTINPLTSIPPSTLNSTSIPTPSSNTNQVTIPASVHSPAFQLPANQVKALAHKVVTNAFNFLASFSSSGKVSGDEKVPLKTFQDWWRKFESKVESDPSLLSR